LDQDAIGVVSSRASADFLSKCVVVDPAQKLASTEISSSHRILSSPISQNIAVVDRTADVQIAAEEVVASRLAFGGRSRYAVDIVMVNEFHAGELTKAVIQAMERYQATANETETSIRSKSFKSSSRTLDNAAIDKEVRSKKAKVVYGNSETGIVEILDRYALNKIP
jgi:aldehyde dehydrogenase (NAD+)